MKDSPSKRAKRLGCKSITDLSKRFNKGRHWMNIQFEKDPELFDIICHGAALKDLLDKLNEK